MFAKNPNTKSDLSLGFVYAIYGIDGKIYYGQICKGKQIAFFKKQDCDVADLDDILESDVMSRFSVSLPSIGRALRSGHWMKIGRGDLRASLQKDTYLVQWPQFTLDVSVWLGGDVAKETIISDPLIQNYEVISAWDAQYHVPERLVVDFDPVEAENLSESAWAVGGPVWRQRKVKEEMSRRFDMPNHQLPQGWVFTDR